MRVLTSSTEVIHRNLSVLDPELVAVDVIACWCREERDGVRDILRVGERTQRTVRHDSPSDGGVHVGLEERREDALDGLAPCFSRVGGERGDDVNVADDGVEFSRVDVLFGE